MTVEDILREFEKGCSNTHGGKPSDCEWCLAGAVKAIEEAVKRRLEEIK